MAKPHADSLPALYPEQTFDSRMARKMSITLGSGPHARDILVVDQAMALIRSELIGIASDAAGAGRETHVTFCISFDQRVKRQ